MFGFSIWTRIFIFLLGMGFGFWFVLKPLQIVNLIGKSAWAENNLPGGTYGAVKLFGIFVMIVVIVGLVKF